LDTFSNNFLILESFNFFEELVLQTIDFSHYHHGQADSLHSANWKTVLNAAKYLEIPQEVITKATEELQNIFSGNPST